MLAAGSLRARTQGSFNYTCMIFILRETRTAVREWACWAVKENYLILFRFLNNIATRTIQISEWSNIKKSSLKLHGQLEQNLTGMMYGKSSKKSSCCSNQSNSKAARGNSSFWLAKTLKSSLLKQLDKLETNFAEIMYGKSP